MISETKIKKFKENGYLVIPNFLKFEEVTKLQSSVTDYRKKKDKNEPYVSLDDENILNLLCNDNLKQILNSIIGPSVYFLHDTDVLDGPVKNNNTWHRDNPCRRTGVGPDWDDKEEYNVVSVALYLCDSLKTQSSLSIIPKSHKLDYSSKFSNILRVLHQRTRNISLLNPLRNLIKFIIAKEIYYRPGDLIIFYCNLYHSGSIINSKKNSVERQGVISRFGGNGKHSLTFMNYELNYRFAGERFTLSKNKEKYFNRLKEKDLYISPYIEKKEIKGVFIPKDQSADRLTKT